ncbi:hypothetical protein E1193_27640, partial [Micromonospora sp. KC606]|uniref:MazG-like family protein n=1 Tax=Micromonospora sp. KC606 TaxID=2530379 RepID=UPI0010E4C90D
MAVLSGADFTTAHRGAGEAATAWIGLFGQNPREGVMHTRDDVAAELADVVFTALVAIESLGLDARSVVSVRAATRVRPGSPDRCAGERHDRPRGGPGGPEAGTRRGR